MAYSERVAEVMLATNIQLSSLRIAIEFAPTPAATFAGVRGVKAPVAEPILNPETWP